MVDMFTNYQNLAQDYIPNNLAAYHTKPCSYTKLDPQAASKPYELYDAKGNLEGYYWYEGNQIVLDFSIDGEITIESNALILSVANQVPSNRTEGRLGQQIYNIIDKRSWTCTAYAGLDFVWTENDEFIHPLDKGVPVFIDAADYLKDKSLRFNLYNFRMDVIHTISNSGTNKFKIFIDNDLAKKLVRGIYYCSLEVISKDGTETLFAPTDCKLLVK